MSDSEPQDLQSQHLDNPVENVGPRNTQALEQKLNTPEGDTVIANVKKAVFDEFDRALIEGTATKDQVNLQKKHTETVVEIAQVSVGELRAAGIPISDLQERTVLIEAYLHDVMKIVPERENLLSEDLFDFVQRGLVSKIKAIDSDLKGVAGVDSNAVRAYVAKRSKERLDIIAELGERGMDEAELTRRLQIEQDLAGQSGWGKGNTTRLLMHGEDASGWSKQLLIDMGFSETYADKVGLDITQHMGMPYVNNALRQVQRLGQNISGEVVIPDNLIPGPPPMVQQMVYPEPSSVEAAILMSADFMSAQVMAGRDIATDPIGGGFDKYLAIDLSFFISHSTGQGLKDAFDGAYKSLKANVEYLQFALGDNEAERIEKIIGRRVGGKILAKFDDYRSFVESGEMVIGDRVVKGFDQLEVAHKRHWKDNEGKEAFVQTEVDPDETLMGYYKSVDAWRKSRGVDLNDVRNR